MEFLLLCLRPLLTHHYFMRLQQVYRQLMTDLPDAKQGRGMCPFLCSKVQARGAPLYDSWKIAPIPLLKFTQEMLLSRIYHGKIIGRANAVTVRVLLQWTIFTIIFEGTKSVTSCQFMESWSLVL